MANIVAAITVPPSTHPKTLACTFEKFQFFIAAAAETVALLLPLAFGADGATVRLSFSVPRYRTFRYSLCPPANHNFFVGPPDLLQTPRYEGRGGSGGRSWPNTPSRRRQW